MTAPFRPAVVVITGGAGFIGSNLIRWLLTKDTMVRVINVDALTYAANLENLTDIDRRHGASGDGRYHFVHADIQDAQAMVSLLAGEPVRGSAPALPAPDAVLHLA